MKVLVVTGGNSEEREVSLWSGKNVVGALKQRNYDVVEFDFKDGLPELEAVLKRIDVVFPVLHGYEGEGGDLQKLLEKKEIKFIGSGSNACRNSWNKVYFKKLCDKNKITTASWKVIKRNQVKNLRLEIPFVIKPVDSGSSVDTWIIKTERELKNINFEFLFKKYPELLIERFIDGVEVTVGILENTPLTVIEIRPPEGEWFNYENKYNGKTQEIPNAPSLTEEQRKEVQTIALKVHNLLDCRHFSRSDFILGNDGLLYILELNTIPGLTSESLFPKAAKAAGISFEEMVDKLVLMAK